MKKLLLAIFTFVFAVSMNVQAQLNCEPDPMFADTTAGVYPLPDPVGSPTSSLNPGCVNVDYAQLFTAVVPDSIMTVFNGIPVTAELISVTVDTIIGLPAGVSYACDPPDCGFLQNSTGCVLFSGVPTEAGDFLPVVQTTVVGSIGALITIPVNFPSQGTPGEVEIFPGEYKITVHPAGSTESACIVDNVNDALAGVLGVQQNVPNPFSRTTSITIDSKESGQFDFKVYSVIGELVHSEVLTLSTGENIFEFDGADLNSGMYFYAVGQGNAVVTKRMVVSK